MQTSDDKELRDALKTLLCADEFRMRLLHAVESLRLPDCWIGAGFIRAAVWDLKSDEFYPLLLSMGSFAWAPHIGLRRGCRRVWFDRAQRRRLIAQGEAELAAK
jgi:hypothetical protein